MVMHRRLKIFLWIAVPVLALGLTGFVLLRHLESTYWKVARLVDQPIPVQVAQVGTGAVDESLPAEGTAKELEIVPLSALEAGQVVKINARLGDVVRKGDRLIEMDPAPLGSKLKVAQEQLASAQQQLAIYTKKAAVAQDLFDRQLIALDELNAALLNKLTSEQSVAQKRDAEVQATVDMKAGKIDSPVNGIVTVRNVYVGAIVNSASPIMTVSQVDPILIQAPYTEDKIPNIYIGQPARVSFYAFPGQTFEGKVQWINPVIDNATRLMTVQVVLSNHDLKLLPGMRGIVRLNNRQAEVLRVPTIALLSTFEDSAYVFVVDENKIARVRKIRIGAYAEGYIEVKSGLQAGEEVVIVGQVGLKDNDRVRVFDASGAERP